MLKLLLLATGLLPFSIVGKADDFYAWRDAQGVIDYSDTPTGEGARDVKILRVPRQVGIGGNAAKAVTREHGPATPGGPATATGSGSAAPSGTTAADDGTSVVKFTSGKWKQTFFCTFANSPTDCGFQVQEKVPGRATIVNIGRDGGTALRLHTEPGDDNVAGSGTNERDDLTLSVPETDGYQGREQWWAHSILFPSDFASPPAGFGVVADFHNASPGGGQAGGQANFHVDSSRWDGETLHFRGYGGVLASSSDTPGEYQVTLGPIVKNLWYDFVYHVKWSSGSDGFFQAWVNGVKKLDYSGPTLYRWNGVDQEVYLKLANYHTAFGQPSSVIHDRIIRGTSPLAVSLGPLEGVLTLVNGVLTPLQ
jgi:hypothetical protein